MDTRKIHKAPSQPLSNDRQAVLKRTDKGQVEGRPCNDKNWEKCWVKAIGNVR